MNRCGSEKQKKMNVVMSCMILELGDEVAEIRLWMYLESMVTLLNIE